MMNKITRDEYLSCRLSVEERQAVRNQARLEDRTEAELIRRALRTYIRLYGDEVQQQQSSTRIGAVNVGA